MPGLTVNYTEPGGWTMVSHTNGTSDVRYNCNVAYIIVNSTAALTYNPTASNSTVNNTLIATFKG